MKEKKPLSKTNPYLEDPEERERWLRLTVLSSARIEIRLPRDPWAKKTTEKEEVRWPR